MIGARLVTRSVVDPLMPVLLFLPGEMRRARLEEPKPEEMSGDTRRE
jgi:hypothetical protein